MSHIYHQHLRRCLVLLVGQRAALAHGLRRRIDDVLPGLAARMTQAAAESLVAALLESARCADRWFNIQPMLALAGAELGEVGVRSRDYDLLRDSWYWLLADTLEETWDEPMREAWTEVGQHFFDAMRAGNGNCSSPQTVALLTD